LPFSFESARFINYNLKNQLTESIFFSQYFNDFIFAGK
jgi:hypothetical protein